MKKIFKEIAVNWLLIAVLLLAFILRFWELNSYPALNADEAAIGYNAYSLIKTGLDEHGHAWPIHFQSFNDWKPGLYFYLVLPFVKILGLTEWAVRIPNAALGVATVLVIYFLVKELFPGRRYLPEISAFFLAISPWHIHFSRGGWEVGTSTFFIVLGVTAVIHGINNRFDFKSLTVGIVSLVLSLYTYHASRVIVPLLGVGILGIYRKEIFIKDNLKRILGLVLLFALLLTPLMKDLVSGDALSRAAGVGLFADKGPINRINEQRGEHGDPKNVFGILVHNKPVNYGLAFFDNWTSHFQGEFLFFTGDAIERNKVPETGEMYLFDVIFLALGFIAIFRNMNKGWVFTIYWLLVAPIAAALTFQAPHALRAENMVIPLIIISAFGLTSVIEWGLAQNRKVLSILSIFIITVVAWNFSRYLHMYYLHMSKEFPYSSQYGVKELVLYVKENGDKYKDIVVTDRYDQPYILFLFYLKYPPENFQNNHVLTPRDEFGFSTVRDFGKYHFTSIDFQKIKEKYPNSLIAGTPDEIPEASNVIKRIFGTNGFEYFDIVAN